jgi:hypothetical protein
MGRPDWLGASQAMATMAQICSAVIVAGLPERGASLRRSSRLSSARGIGWNICQRARQCCTRSRVTSKDRAISELLRPSAAAKRTWARRASCCGVECRRSRAFRASRCSLVSSTAKGLGPRMSSSAGCNRMRHLGRVVRIIYCRPSSAKLH